MITRNRTTPVLPYGAGLYRMTLNTRCDSTGVYRYDDVRNLALQDDPRLTTSSDSVTVDQIPYRIHRNRIVCRRFRVDVCALIQT